MAAIDSPWAFLPQHTHKPVLLAFLSTSQSPFWLGSKGQGQFLTLTENNFDQGLGTILDKKAQRGLRENLALSVKHKKAFRQVLLYLT